MIDCGPDAADSALIDIPHPGEYEDAAPIACEAVAERAPNSFQPPSEPPGEPAPEAAPPPAVTPPSLPPPKPSPPRDRRRPQTRIAHHPPKLALIPRGGRAVAFRFAADEAGARFRCRLDRRPFRPCASPRRYRVGRGPHAFRVFAVDAAGNRDASPARYRFRARRR